MQVLAAQDLVRVNHLQMLMSVWAKSVMSCAGAGSAEFCERRTFTDAHVCETNLLFCLQVLAAVPITHRVDGVYARPLLLDAHVYESCLRCCLQVLAAVPVTHRVNGVYARPSLSDAHVCASHACRVACRCWQLCPSPITWPASTRTTPASAAC